MEDTKRNLILRLIEAHPGIYRSELQRRSRLNLLTLDKWISVLHYERLIRIRKVGRIKELYPIK